MLERAHIRRMIGYVPGLQPAAGAIKLNTNENPFPPTPAVMARLADVLPLMLQRYPDPLANELRRVVARLHGLASDQVVATNGGDELLRLALTTFADPDRPIGIVTPSYGLYSILAALHRAPLSDVALDEAWRLPHQTASRWNADGAQLALLTNPHAPSGTLFPMARIERLASSFKGVLLIDEAYVDFVDPTAGYDATRLVKRHPNVLLLRTLSKGYSLAGLRLAYGLGDAGLIEPILGKTKDSYNVDAIAQLLGATALEDQAHARASWEAVRTERGRLSRDLLGLGFDVAPSQGNFLLGSVPREGNLPDAHQVYTDLMQRSIYVRWFDADRLRDKLRITIGTPNENAVLVSALREIMGRMEPT